MSDLVNYTLVVLLNGEVLLQEDTDTGLSLVSIVKRALFAIYNDIVVVYSRKRT